MRKIASVIALALFLLPFSLSSEGTKELMPTSSQDTRILIAHGPVSGQARDPFALESNTDSNYRLCIRITDWQHEKICFGLGASSGNPVNWKIWLPDGSGTIFSGTTPAIIPLPGQQGTIYSYTEATNGPNIINPAGYWALEANPTANGDYYMTFSLPSTNTQRDFLYFDITVVSTASGPPAAVNGRVFSKCWQIRNPNSGPFTYYTFAGMFYVYSNDRVVTKLDPNNFEGRDFSISANESGCYQISGAMTAQNARKSRSTLQKYPQFRIFLNNPDPTYYIDGVIGSFVPGSLVTTTSCNTGTVLFDFDTQPLNSSGTVQITLTLSTIPPAGTYTDRILTQTVYGGHTTMTWDGKDGSNKQVTSGSTFNFTLMYTMGLSHLPLWDVENNVNGFKVYLIRPQQVPALPDPAFYWDDGLVSGTVMVNPPGCSVPPSTSCHAWSGSWGDQKTINTWWYVSSDVSIPTSLTYKKSPSPVTSVTGPATLCPGASGTYTVPSDTLSTTFIWTWDYGSTVTTSPTATITIPPNAIAGSMNLEVHGNNAVCGDGTGRTIQVNIKPVPNVVADPASPFTVCDSVTTNIALSSSVPGTTTGTSFSWNAAAADPTKVLPPTATGSTTTSISQLFKNISLVQQDVIFTITPSNNGCTGTAATFTLVINPTPHVLFNSPGNPPNPQLICSGNASLPVVLSADVSIPSPSYVWTVSCNSSNIQNCPAAGGGTSIPPASPLNLTGSAQDVVYHVSATLPAGGSVTCQGPASHDTLRINPKPALSNTVLSQDLCSGATSTPVVLQAFPPPPANVSFNWTAWPSSPLLTGYASGATSSLQIPLQTIINPTSTAQYVDDSIIPILSGSISCPGDKKVYRFNINPLPSPVISGPVSVCALTTGSVYSSPAVAGHDYSWTVTGAVSFTGNNSNTITVNWGAGPAGTVTLTETDQNYSTNCNKTTQAFNVTIHPNPTPQISGNQSPCGQSTHTYSLGTSQAGHSYSWTVSGGTPSAGSNASISVTWGNTNPVSISASETITYPGGVNCSGNAPAFPVVLVPVPDAAGTITGTSPVCNTWTRTYSVAPIPNADGYAWWYAPSTGVNITNNGTTATVLFDAAAGSGNLYVKGTRTGCSDGPASPAFPVVVNALPYVSLSACNDPKTTTTSRAFTLKGGVPPGGSYYLDGSLLPGGVINPAVLSTTTHQVTYQYTDRNSCTNATPAVTLTVVNGSSLTSCPQTFTDVRDNKVYKASMWGGRCWMLANLNYGTAMTSDAQSQTDNCIPEKYCAPSDAACTSYGGFYQWQEIMDYSSPGPGQLVQGLCPPEWHVPTLAEWQMLIDGQVNAGNGIAGGDLKDPNPALGFRALLGGLFYQNSIWAAASGGLKGTMLWTSESSGSSRGIARGLNSYDESVSLYHSSRSNAFPVRCVKD
jgi:uncharacterized protein (TIGR02145 family)